MTITRQRRERPAVGDRRRGDHHRGRGGDSRRDRQRQRHRGSGTVTALDRPARRRRRGRSTPGDSSRCSRRSASRPDQRCRTPFATPVALSSVATLTVLALSEHRAGGHLHDRGESSQFDEPDDATFNVEQAGPNDLQVVSKAQAFNRIWIAVSIGRGTIVKIDTDSGAILGEYQSAPDGQPRNPSRTTVDQNGSVWATNRDGNSVLQIGLVENGQCIDRNGNGVIDTSTGQGDIKPWTNAGGVDTDGGVDHRSRRVHPQVRQGAARAGTRHVSVNADNDIWVSGTGGRFFDLVDGETGDITAHGRAGRLRRLRRADRPERRDLVRDVPRRAPPLGHEQAAERTRRPGLNWEVAATRSRSEQQLRHLHRPVRQRVGDRARLEHAQVRARRDTARHLLPRASIRRRAARPTTTATSGSHTASTAARPSVTSRTRASSSATSPSAQRPTGISVDANGKIWSANYYAQTASAGSTRTPGPSTGPPASTSERSTSPPSVCSGNPYNYSDMTGLDAAGPAGLRHVDGDLRQRRGRGRRGAASTGTPRSPSDAIARGPRRGRRRSADARHRRARHRRRRACRDSAATPR